MNESTLERIRAARHRISARFNHNPQRLVEYYINRQSQRKPTPAEASTKAYSVAKIRERYARAYQKWTDDDEAVLRSEFLQGRTTKQLSDLLQRQPSSIRSHLRKIGLVE